MSEKETTREELAQEAKRWDARELTPKDWEEAPEAVVRPSDQVPLQLSIPAALLKILNEFARRQNIDHHELVKLWLNERIRQEYERMSGDVQTEEIKPKKLSKVG